MQLSRKQYAGLLLTVLLSLLSLLLGHFLPQLGAESIALLAGLVLGNLVFTQDRWQAGVLWAEKYPIEIGIACLGFQITLHTIQKIGLGGIIFILLQMIATILLVYWVGRKIFKVDLKAGLLMAAGNAVCGSSAIAAVAPKISASDNQRRTSVAIVSLSGIVLLFVLPVLGPLLYQDHSLLVGALIGGTLQSVGQVIGAASLVNGSVTVYATLFKMLRIICLFIVVLGMAKFVQVKEAKENKPAVQVNGFKLVPWFIYVFLILMLLGSLVQFPQPIVTGAKSVTSFFSVINLAGIGLNLKWSVIKASGAKLLSYGLVTITIQVLLAVTLIMFIF